METAATLQTAVFATSAMDVDAPPKINERSALRSSMMAGLTETASDDRIIIQDDGDAAIAASAADAEKEEDASVAALGSAMEQMALTMAERFNFAPTSAAWIATAQRDFETGVSASRSTAVRTIGKAPTSNPEWREYASKIFGDDFTDYFVRGDPDAPGRRDEPEKWEDLCTTLQENETAMLRGYRRLMWVDPHYTRDLAERKFAMVPVSAGIGVRYAVIVGVLNEHADQPNPYTIFTVDMASLNANCANHAAFTQRKLREEKMKESAAGFKAMVEEKTGTTLAPEVANQTTAASLKAAERAEGITSYLAYELTSHPRIPEPSDLTVHGEHFLIKHARIPASIQPPGRNTPILCDRFERLELPKCSPNDAVVMEFPTGIVQHMDYLHPFFLVLCAGQDAVEVASIIVGAESKQIDLVREASKDKISVVMVFDISYKERQIVKTIAEAECTIWHAQLSPRMTCPADTRINPNRFEVLWSLQSANPKHNGATLKMKLFTPKDVPNSDKVTTEILCADADQELTLFEKTGKRFNSPPVEAPRCLYSYPQGHIVQISRNNLGMLITANEPAFPKPHAYVTRDLHVVDMLIYGNAFVKLTSDDRLSFGTIRCANEEDAELGVPEVSSWELSELVKKHGDRAHIEAKPGLDVGSYKAIWATTKRIAVLFPDSTLVIFTTMSNEDIKRARDSARKAQEELSRRAALKSEAERQVATAVRAAKK